MVEAIAFVTTTAYGWPPSCGKIATAETLAYVVVNDFVALNADAPPAMRTVQDHIEVCFSRPYLTPAPVSGGNLWFSNPACQTRP